MRSTTVLLASTFLLAALAGCTATEEDLSIHLGSLMPLTGPAASLGVDAAQGSRLAVQEINAAGGIEGKPIELLEGDTKFPETAEAVSEFDRLAGENVHFIIGALASDSSAAISPKCTAAQIVCMSPSSTRPSLTGPDHGYFYRNIANDDVQGPQAADFVYNHFQAGAALVMFQQTGYAQGLKDVFVPAYEALGGQITGDPIAWTDDEATLPGKAAEAAGQNPRFIWIAGQAPEIGSLIKELRSAGYAGDILTSEAIEADALFDVASSEDLADVYFTKASPDVSSQTYLDFAADYEAEFGEGPGAFSAYAYDAVYVAAAAIEAVGNDGAAIKAWLDDNEVDGRVTTSSIGFFQGDVTTGGFTLWTIEDGDFVPA